MMTPEQAEAMYKNIEFYEVTEDGLIGPLNNIFFTVVTKKGMKNEYPYAEVIDGQITRAFKEDEIETVDTSAPTQ